MLLLDGQVHHDTHLIPMGNYVIAVGNYVSVSPSDLGNYVSAEDPARISLTGIYLGQAVIAIAAVLAVTSEYSTGMIRVTLTAMPGRATVLAAKAAVLTGPVLVAGALAVLGSMLAGRLILPGHGIGPAHGYPDLSLASGPILRAAVGSVLYLALIALLSLGTAAAVRYGAAAIGIVLGLLYLLPILGQLAGNGTWHRHLEQLAPMTAGPGDPGHHRPAQPAHQPMGGPWRARRLDRRGPPDRRDPARSQ